MNGKNTSVTFEEMASEAIRLIGGAIEIFGVLVIVAGIAGATFLYLQCRFAEEQYEAYKIRIGRSLLPGLEVLVAADIIKTVALDLTFMSLGVLTGLVLVRTFLSRTLTLAISGRWPWQGMPPRRGARLETQMLGNQALVRTKAAAARAVRLG